MSHRPGRHYRLQLKEELENDPCAVMLEKALGSRSVHPLVTRFAKNVHAKGLVSPDSRLLVSVSGGPDSVALLSLFLELRSSWRLDLHVVHINHALRGKESEEDATFVMKRCEDMGVTFHLQRCPMGRGAGGTGGASIQEKARDARYDVLTQVGQEIGAQRIALGHTADDQAETVLMWIIRGAGGKGLAGIPSVREDKFVRPLLGIRRGEILEYLNVRGLSFRMDSSNSNLRYLRNRIRQQIIPTLQELNSGIVTVLNRQAEIFREEDGFMDMVTSLHLDQMVRKEGVGGWVLPRAEFLLLAVPLQRRMVREMICRLTGLSKGLGFGGVSALLNQVIHGPTGSSLLIQGVRVTRDYGRIRWILNKEWLPEKFLTNTKTPRPPSGLPLDIPGYLVWPLTGQGFSTRVFSRKDAEWQRFEKSSSPTHRALFDANLVKGTIQVRAWSPGDTFRPFGMGGKHKKIQDFFSDIKLPRWQRHRLPLVVGQEGILWVAGHRMDQRFVVKPSTRTILCIEVEPHLR